MATISSSAIMKKLQAYAETPSGKAKIAEAVKKKVSSGVSGVSGSSSGSKSGMFMSDADVILAAQYMIDLLTSTAQQSGLPDSVLAHFNSLKYSINKLPDGSSCVDIYFNDDMHRDSLYPKGYKDGIDNIVALFNNGYEASNYVYGSWDSESIMHWDDYRGEGNDFHNQFRSLKTREGLYFITSAIKQFNNKYKNFNVTAVGSDVYD